MIKIPFNVSARTARLIGRENLSNSEGALIELIKNSYDADAKHVMVVFVDNEVLYIVDDGHGMTEEAIKSSWMTIGTDNKELQPYSPNGRVKAGAKGIGRFALDKLGEKIDLYTLPKEGRNGYHWSVNWSDFEKNGKAVSDVLAILEEVKDLSLEQQLPSVFKTNNELAMKFSTGGTILKISTLRDKWTKEELQNLYRSMETLVPEMEDDLFLITLSVSGYKGEFGLVKPLISEDFDYQIRANYDSKNKSIDIDIERNEFDILMLEKKYHAVFLDPLMKNFPFDLKTFKKGRFSQKYKIEEIVRGFTDPDNLLEQIGNFTFALSFAKNDLPNPDDVRKYPYKNAEYSSRSEWLKRFGGIKIFRDNFRVRPYGEMGEDWLKLGERVAKSPAGPGQGLGGYRVRPNQVVGSVYISRIDNKMLQDKSSREGIQENEIFSILKEVLFGIVSILEKDRNTIFYALSELNKKVNKRDAVKAEAREAANRINNKVKEDKGTTSLLDDPELKKDAAKVTEALEVLESEIEEKHQENKILRSLASAGLITAAVAHELRGLENILLTRNEELKSLIEPYISEESLKLKGIKDAYNPYVLLAEMEKTDKDLHEWISYALTPLKRDKRLRKTVSLSNYFEDLYTMWKHILEERKIDFVFDNLDKSFAVKAFVIDLDTVFNNLIINSIESFSRKKDNKKREILISGLIGDEYCKITYSDNGVGLDNSYKSNPSDIFLPQETTKRDNTGKVIGTGMGMYLVKSVIDENRGKAEVLLPKEGFSIALFLPILSK